MFYEGAAATTQLREVNEQLVFRLVQAQEDGDAARDLKQLADLAGDVQRGLLPRPCPIPGLEVYSTLIQRHEVGGDFYDILQCHRQRRRGTFLVGDVVGKGMPAALVMVMALTHFRDIARTTTSPSRILQGANERLCQSLRNSTIYNVLSASVLVVDMKTRRANFARAGHEGLLIYRAASASVEELSPAGLLLGVRAGEKYPSITFPVVRGDLMILFTDGITEARDATGAMFGIDRLKDLVKARTHPDLQAFGDHLIAQVQQFEARERLRDDVILLMIEVME